MFWYKLKTLPLILLTGGVILLSVLPSCKPAIKETGAKLKYFDIEGYFEKEAVRLTRQNQPVLKTAEHNNVTETKKVHIANWELELSLFKQSDINKPAWRDNYTIQNSDNILTYSTNDPTLTTRKILIKQVNGRIKWILIFNQTPKTNKLYKTVEKLSYFPDSLYLIEKSISVRLLGTNKYRIKGFFN